MLAHLRVMLLLRDDGLEHVMRQVLQYLLSREQWLHALELRWKKSLDRSQVLLLEVHEELIIGIHKQGVHLVLAVHLVRTVDTLHLFHFISLPSVLDEVLQLH